MLDIKVNYLTSKYLLLTILTHRDETMGSDHITLYTAPYSFSHTTENTLFCFGLSFVWISSFLLAYSPGRTLVLLQTPTCSLFLPLSFVSEETGLLVWHLRVNYLTLLVLMHVYCLVSSSFQITGYMKGVDKYSSVIIDRNKSQISYQTGNRWGAHRRMNTHETHVCCPVTPFDRNRNAGAHSANIT